MTMTMNYAASYGLWVFSMDGYFPLSGGDDTCSGEPDVARFGQFLAWRCERGAEVVFGGENSGKETSAKASLLM